ncbi:PepSY-associated TM helix domain-containing protein [Thauera aromatica]|uniref:PepSY-associated TM helix domain-containing protein n=1 Tax=Thauera aromatica TaxID=59405 RepID=UPI001FFDCFDB|nr:PepSY-associated TM helix domain-containing protein [Thauera aromatica]MCK2096027.1 PepSY domain-containing protein [Thauera aromatica]
MSPHARRSMSALHTWAGVVLGSLMLLIFWMGTLSVFDREIDRWMMPETRLPPSVAAAPLPSFDQTVLPVAQRLAAYGTTWSVVLPSARTPVHTLRHVDDAGRAQRRHLDPRTGAVLEGAASEGASGFFFPLHFRLHLRAFDLGYWIVGLAGMAVLALLVSGVIIHRRLLAEFFVFRPARALPRTALDLHNLSGVLALPFHFTMALSGLAILFTIYFPTAYQAAYAHAGAQAREAFEREAMGKWSRPPAGQAGTLASVDAMLARAQAAWDGGRPYFIRVRHAGDAASYVEVRRAFTDEVTMNLDILYFDAASGEVLHQHRAAGAVGVQRFLTGLHFIQFEHWTLRWLYFIGGLGGCVMIASGLLFWLEARRRRPGAAEGAGFRLVEALGTASTTGLVAATLAFLLANRLLPAAIDGRAALEMQAFFAAWALMLAHAHWRGRRAWREQCAAIAALALGALTLNWLGTGALPWQAPATGAYAVAGVDALLLATALAASWAARCLGRRAQRHTAPAARGEEAA